MTTDGGVDGLRREFARDVRWRLDRLRRAVEGRDVEQARRLAHALNGSARALALESLRCEIERVEELLAREPLPSEAEEAVERAIGAADDDLPLDELGPSGGEAIEQLCHDLRTPLSAVWGFAQLLRRSDLTEEQKRYLDGIVDAGERLSAMLDDAVGALCSRRPAIATDVAERRGPDTGGDGVRALTIVYVEDDPVSVAVLQGLLATRPDVRLVIAVTGAEGVALAAAVRPDLVLLDLGLPDIDGAEVVRRLRATASPPPVAVVTGDTRPERIAELRDAGVDDYFAKPVDLRRLLDLVDEVAHA